MATKNAKKKKKTRRQPFQPLQQTLGPAIRALRFKDGKEWISQNKAALMCDVGQEMLSRYEASKRIPSVAALQKIAAGFGVRAELVFHG